MLSTGITAQSGRDEFLQLLVTQLRNQDPLQPVEQQDFIAQLAQFSTLDGVEKMNANFEELLALQEDQLRSEQVSRGAAMLGQNVHFDIVDTVVDDTGERQERIVDSGIVEGVDATPDGLVAFVGSRRIPLTSITGIGEYTPSEGAVRVDSPVNAVPDELQLYDSEGRPVVKQ